MRVNQLSALTVTADFLEQDRTGAVPSTVHWRLKCLETDAVLQDWTEATYTSTLGDDGAVAESEATIEVSGALHDMQTEDKALERKALVVSADKDLATEYNAELVYEVQRLYGRD